MADESKKNEITSLNADDLDVEELENRLELAVGGIENVWVCGVYVEKEQQV
jgi:hypothetical protein